MPKNFRAARALAYVFYSRHEFGPAAAQARRAVEMNPEDGDSYGILGDALLEVGQYAEAEAAYDYMIELEQSLYSYSRRAGLKSMRGDSAAAIADLERAVALGKAAKQPSESIAWTEWQLGMEYFAYRRFIEVTKVFPAIIGELSELLSGAGELGAATLCAEAVR
jgi:tetratricopeptide (TPR) repeat protein